MLAKRLYFGNPKTKRYQDRGAEDRPWAKNLPTVMREIHGQWVKVTICPPAGMIPLDSEVSSMGDSSLRTTRVHSLLDSRGRTTGGYRALPIPTEGDNNDE